MEALVEDRPMCRTPRMVFIEFSLVICYAKPIGKLAMAVRCSETLLLYIMHEQPSAVVVAQNRPNIPPIV